MTSIDHLFDSAITAAVESIPQHLREKIKNVAFVVEDEPSSDVREQEGLADDETLLGYYQGVPNSVRGDSYGIGMTMPDTITLYRNPIRAEAGDDEEQLRQIIYETVLHEVAHYFGMDEDEVHTWEERGRIPHAHTKGGHFYRAENGE